VTDGDCYSETVNKYTSTVIRLYGVSSSQNTFLVHVRNFVSYFYVECPTNFDPNPAALALLIDHLDHIIRTSKNSEGKVTQILSVQKESLHNYKGASELTSTFLQIFVSVPTLVPTMRQAFENGHCNLQNNVQFAQRTFESNMPYVLRFMIDKDLPGCGWVTLPKGTYQIISDPKKYVSRSQIEIAIDTKDLIAQDCQEAKWSDIAPLRIMSFDIECNSLVGFPIPERDPVITIACVGKTHGRKEKETQIVFQLDTCDNIVGADLRTFKTDKELIEAFGEF
jgi:DNA polymerase delta subunit 1